MSKRTEESLRARVREAPLIERLNESRKRIAAMCSERRGPRMTIPVQHYDDDFFICTTLEDARDEVARLRAFIQRVGHPQWCSGFMTRNIDACTCGYYVIIPPVQAALTPQAGKGGGA